MVFQIGLMAIGGAILSAFIWKVIMQNGRYLKELSVGMEKLGIGMEKLGIGIEKLGKLIEEHRKEYQETSERNRREHQETLRYIVSLISAEGEKTRELIRQFKVI